MYLHQFLFLRPHHLTESEKFNIQYPDPLNIPTTADKLRYYRYKKSLLQREVAEYAGIDVTTYASYEESGQRDYYPQDKLRKVAELLEVDVELLLDDYNRFLLNQGAEVRKIRKGMGLTQYQFGKLYGVSAGAVKRWESGKARMFKGTWERILD